MVNLLIIGDAMTDVYVYGTLQPCQDGCQKFVEASRHSLPGGAANAARSLMHQDCTIAFPQSVDISIKTRFIADGRIVFRLDNDAIPIDTDYRRSVLAALALPIDGVLISDYDKGALSESLLREVITTCVRRGIPCVADVKRVAWLYSGAIRKGNEDYVGECEVRTRGQRPPTVEGRAVPHPNTPVTLLNHVGAGDCFAAHLLLALANGAKLVDACTFAHSAGRVYVQHRHNYPPSIQEIRVDLGQEIV